MSEKDDIIDRGVQADQLLKNKSYLIQRIVGCLFIVISIFLLIDLFK